MILLFLSCVICACEDFTDLQPKGKNILSSIEDLEMLLDNEYSNNAVMVREISGDLVFAMDMISTQISQPNKTAEVIRWTYDESNIDRLAELTVSDADYTRFYNIIGTIANPVLLRVDDTDGTDAMKRQFKCEALALRAYFHYLLVNKFAKAYNPSTASQKEGIIYLTEDVDITVPQKKKTVQEVYDLILADINQAIDLGGLPDKGVTYMRMNKAAAYAVKALALYSMQRFEQAEEAARQSINVNGAICDYNDASMTTMATGYILGMQHPVILRDRKGVDEDLFYMYNQELLSPVPTEAWNAFETGHACKDRMSNYYMLMDYIMNYAPMMIGEDWIQLFDMNSGWNATGITVPRIYLIIAQAEIEKGNINAAMEALDMIRVKRINPALYQPLKGNVSTKAEAISHLKQTAHGENFYSYYGFIFKKAWNQLDDYKQTYGHVIGGVNYTISPDSPLWIFPFPSNAIENNPNLTQNYKTN